MDCQFARTAKMEPLEVAPDLSRVAFKSEALTKAAPATVEGDTLLGMYASFLGLPKTPSAALYALQDACTTKRMKRVVSGLADGVEQGRGISQVLENQRILFGDLAAVFASLGESGCGLRASLERYGKFRHEVACYDLMRPPGASTYHTRRFALLSGTLMDMGMNAPQAFHFGALEHPMRFRRAVQKAVQLISAGEDFSESFEPRHRFFPFRFGFDPFFLNVVRAGEQEGGLARLLIDFGSKEWGLGVV